MEYGLSFLPDIADDTYTATEYFQNALKLSKFADEAGLTTIKMTEHYLHSYGGYCPSPLMFLASVAAITNQIRLMTGCILPVFHHPLKIAADTSMLDAISQGRLDVGFARAYLPYEFSAFEIDMDSSREKFQETIATVKKLWTENNVSCKSNFYNFKNLNSFPKPTQPFHPPLWGAAVNARQSFAWLGEQGFNLLVTPPLTKMEDLIEKLDIYREAFSPNEVTKEPKIAISLPLLIREDQVEAELKGDEYLSEYIRVWADAADSWTNTSSINYPGYTGMSYALRHNSAEHMRETNQAVIGTPIFVALQIKEIIQLTNIDQILWQIDFGGQKLDSMMNTLSLFVNKVLPLLRQENV
jgi:alkanesulfonate monooxygenase SsuD/methylene tetrahydromethanopterin reductase-like flavin-dependent oxidoreductase (luciferase family)